MREARSFAISCNLTYKYYLTVADSQRQRWLNNEGKRSDLICRRNPRKFEYLVAATSVLLCFLLRSSDTHTHIHTHTHTHTHIYIYIYIYIYATVLSNITPFSCFQKIVFLCVAEMFRNMRSAQARRQSPERNRAYSFQGRSRIFSKRALCYFSFFIGFDYHRIHVCIF